MLTDILILSAGFVLLIKGADYLVDGASRLARRFGVAPLIVGLTIVAFGTSAPEFIVNIIAAIQNATDLTIGNIIGSNLSNIGLIVGLTALLYPLKIQESTIKSEIPFMLLSGLVLLAAVMDRSFGGQAENILSRNDGIILLLVFLVFIYYLVDEIQENRKIKNRGREEFKDAYRKIDSSIVKLSFLTLGGILAVLLGGKLTVDGAINIASALGISQMLIGVTIVAIGTSLPELTTSIMAAYRKHSDIAVGNIVGSNIFNTLLVLGVSAIIRPVEFAGGWYFDLVIMLVFSLTILLFAFTHKRVVKRWEGGTLLLSYILYIVFAVARG